METNAATHAVKQMTQTNVLLQARDFAEARLPPSRPGRRAVSPQGVRTAPGGSIEAETVSRPRVRAPGQSRRGRPCLS